jgi:glycosyltransferase involved in cell wall biosynthesis
MRPQGISVVIPAFNYGCYLPQTISSVLNQTRPASEVLVIDDGSTDDTPGTVLSLSAGASIPLRYIHQQNAGLSVARNTGIRETRHPYIAFLDADDLWESRLLECVMERYAQLPPEYGLVATGSSRMDADGARIALPNRQWDTDGEFNVRDFCLRNRPLSSSVVIRREVFDAIGGFDTELRSSEDRDLWIRATAAGFRFWFINEPLCRIRRHAGNMSKSAPRMKANSGLVLRRAWMNGAVSRWNLPLWQRAFAIHHQQVATTHFEAGYRLRAFAYLAFSVLIWPFFLNPIAVYEPPLFRVRTLFRFIQRTLSGRRV